MHLGYTCECHDNHKAKTYGGYTKDNEKGI